MEPPPTPQRPARGLVRPRGSRPTLAIIAAALGLLAAWALAQDWAPGVSSLALVAGALAAAAASLSPTSPRAIGPYAGAGRTTQPQSLMGLTLIAVSLAGTAVAIPRWHHQWPVLLPLWLAGCVGALGGAALLGFSDRSELVDGRRPMTRRETIALIGILLLATVLRVWNLDEIPPGIFVDETNAALDALRIREGRPLSPFGTGWFETPLLYAYYLAGLFHLGGVSFSALKAASLLPAILTVAAVFPLARHLFGTAPALLATLFMALSRWHLTMSRWGWNELMPPLFHLLAAWTLLVALERRRAWLFLGSGMILGLCVYTYLSSRLVLAAMAAYVAWRCVSERGFLRRQGAGLALWITGIALVVAPLAWTYIQSPFSFLNRSRQLSILREIEAEGSLDPLVENIERHLLMFHHAGDLNGRHNLPGEPMLDLVSGALLLVGVGVALRRVLDHRYALLLLWIAIVLAGGILSTLLEGPQAYRTLGVVPAIAILCGAALAGVADAARQLSRRAWVGALVACAALVWSGASSARTYFVEQARDETVWWGFNPGPNAVARELRSERERLGDLSHAYLTPDLYYFAVVRFLLYSERRDEAGGVDRPEYHLLDARRDLPLLLSRPRDVLLLADLGLYETTARLARVYYPDAEAVVVADHGRQLYGRIAIPRSAFEALRGLSRVTSDGVPTDAPRSDRGSIQLSLEELAAGECLAGALNAPRTGTYRFVSSGPILLELDGGPVGPELVLGRGLYDLRVCRLPGTDRPEILVQAPGEELQPLPPDMLFRLAASRAGLRGHYFQNAEWSGPALFERIDPFFSHSWTPEEPLADPFSVRWTGRLRASKSGVHRFELHCDDGCALWIAGEPVAARLEVGVHVVAGSRHLEAGEHEIRIDYFQAGGAKSMSFHWAPPDTEMTPVPPEAMVPTPREPRASNRDG